VEKDDPIDAYSMEKIRFCHRMESLERSASIRMYRSKLPANGKFATGLLTILLFSFLLIFVSKPVHIDDTVFLKTGEFLAEHPWKPFSFELNWGGKSVSIFNEDNPFLIPYFEAFVTRIGGQSETILHIAFMIFPFLAMLAYRGIASGYKYSANTASVLLITSPAFLVSATTLMADIPLIAFYLLACYFYVRFCETLKTSDGWMFGAMIVLAAFTKYIGLTLIPLLLFDSIRRGILRKSAPYLLLPVIGTLLWCIQNLISVGALHIWDSGKSMNLQAKPVFEKTIAALSFTGLSILGFVVFSCCRSLRSFLLLLGFSIAGGVIVHFFSRTHYFTNTMLMGFGMGSAVFCFTRIDRSKIDAFLALWLVGMFLYVCLAEFVAARVVLLFAPPLLLLLSARVSRSFLIHCVILNFLLSVLVGFADQKSAVFYKNFAEKLPTQHTHYIAHWGMQYYLEKRGLSPFDYEKDSLHAGDLIVVPVVAGTSFYPMPQGSGKYRDVQVILEKEIRFDVYRGIFVMNSPNDAGWYCHGWGMLPYSWGYGPIETIKFFRVTATENSGSNSS